MVEFLTYLLPIVLVYKIVQYLWLSNYSLKTRDQLERLRDELRWIAINNEINFKDKEFLYLDQSISRSNILLPKLNFWVVFYLIFKHRNEPIDKNLEEIQIRISKRNEFKEIYNTYCAIVSSYLIRKSSISYLFLRPLSYIMKLVVVNKAYRASRYHNSDIDDYCKYVTVLPETSKSNLVLC